MWTMIWPLALVVFSNVLYQICTKSVAPDINPFASLTVTYLVGAAASAILFFLLSPHSSLLSEYRRLNWAPFVLGIVIVGLEAGWLYAYKAGWQVSVGFIEPRVVLACALLFVGCFLSPESLTWNKVVGVAVCLVGLVLINLK